MPTGGRWQYGMNWHGPRPNDLSMPASHRTFGRTAELQSFFWTLLLIMGLGGEPAFAQPFRTQTTPPRRPSVEAQQAFQAKMDEQTLILAGDQSLRHLSQHERQTLLEFVVGKVLIVAFRQVGLALLSELSLPAVGGADQGADDFAVLAVLELGKSHFSDRILIEAAKGWLTSVRRKEPARGSSKYEHGVTARRAYRMICLMAGADTVRFKALAEDTALPMNLQRNCGWEYDRALRTWDSVLGPYRPRADQPRTRIDVSYGVAAGNLAIYAQVFRNLTFLESIAEVTGSQISWRAPLAIEMRSCGAVAATWTASTRTLSVCYEMAGDFAELYRDLERR